MAKYKVKTKFVFEGEFEVKATNSQKAREIVEKHCAMTTDGIHSSLPDDEVDWEFKIHSTKQIGKITKI